MHDDFLAAGARIVSVSIDSPGQNAAMVEKLRLPFPLLSDPDRSAVISPFDVADPNDARELARPAVVLVDPSGNERFRFVSRDFAERLPEADVLEQVRSLDLPATTQTTPTPGTPEPGPRAMPLDGLPYYLRGARFAAMAMGLRHAELGDAIKEDSKAYVEEMDRYFEVVVALRRSLRD